MAIIGRQPPADIVIPLPNISARHAEIEHLSGDRYLLTDLGSLNGVYINGIRVPSGMVTPRDRVCFGSFVFNLSEYAHLIPRARSPVPNALPGMPPAPPGASGYAPAGPAAAAPTGPAGMKAPVASGPAFPPRPAGPRTCPNCGSEQVVPIAIFNQKYPKKIKVQGGGCSGCMSCLIILLLLVILGPLLLTLGLLGGLATALGTYAVVRVIQENALIIAVVGFIFLAIVIARMATAPKFICEKCGRRFH